MSTIEPYIVKISIGENIGTGFLIFPKSDSGNVYIVTARHIFADDEYSDLNRPKIRIDFWGNTPSYDLLDSDCIYIGSNNESEDCAVIILPVTVLSEGLISEKAPIPIQLGSAQVAECFTSGYAKITQNNFTRTLYKCQILSDQDYSHDLQIEVRDAVTQLHDTDDLFEGYSGSPIFISISDQIYIVGIFLGYEVPTKRITGIDVSFLNILLERNGLHGLSIGFAELNPVIISDLKKINNNGKRILNRIKNNIGELHITRPELEKELKKVIFEKSLTVVFGKPGIGKSAITKDVLSTLTNTSVITLQGEQLDKMSIEEVFRSPEIGISTEFNELLFSVGLTKNKIILIDSIEKLLETDNAETIIDFFNLVKERDDLHLVLTCRSYAIEQLKIRFLQQFKDFYPFEIPVLNDIELDTVCSKYKFLKPLLLNNSLKRILQIPFNIDKATLIHSGALNKTLRNDLDFKQVMWDYVIEGKENEPDIAVQKRRGEIFSEIAYKRAELMVTYVEVQTADYEVIRALQKDQLIETDILVNYRYSPSHDIYEDWALTRKIEFSFQDYLINPVIQVFFEAIGSAPALRRAFRIWISEKIQVIDFNVKDLILCCLAEKTVATHWKDEILIAIMQSPYSREFLNDNKDFLLQNKFELFKRCILLLRVACQSPDLSNLHFLKPEDKNKIYMSSYLKPYGEGWPTMINFIWDNINKLTHEFKLVMQIVFQWGKSLDMQKLGPEARSAALVLHGYFDFHLAHAHDENFTSLDNDEISEAIQMLLRLANLVPEEVRTMMLDSIGNIGEDDYTRNEFWGKFKNIVLDWNYGYPVCEIFPELVLKIAEAEWLYYPPTEEELQKRYGSSPSGYIPRSQDTEEQFGVTSDRDYRYSPASAYQTPIWHLLRYDPIPTLDFIIRLFNHSVNAFFQSDFAQSGFFGSDDGRSTVNLDLDENTTIEVKGSELLWSIYRGKHNITSPNLLRSVLMALERWILAKAAFVDTDKEQEPVRRENFEFIFNYLLTQSRSASIHAVLISAATANPELCKKLVQPMLKIRAFYKWDLIRCGHERSDRIMFFDDSQLIKGERRESDKMSHRSQEMETLVRRLSLTTEQPKIYAILDEFYAQNPTDVRWKLALNRMDLRKSKVVESTENSLVLMPEIDEELRPMVNEAQKSQDELRPVQIAGNWVLQKWDGKKVENDNYREWQNHYRHISESKMGNETMQLFNQPGTCAVVGIRYFFDELSLSEREWCIEQVFYITKAEIKGSHGQFSLASHGTYSAFDPDHVFQVLVDLVWKCRGNQLIQAKELLFLSLLYINNDLHREKLIESVMANLWQADQVFAFNCVAGLVEYAKIAELRNRIRHFEPGFRSHGNPPWRRSKLATLYINLKNKIARMIRNNKMLEAKRVKDDEVILKEWSDRYEKGVDDIINKVIQGKLEINYERTENVNFSPYYLIYALEIIPVAHNTTEIDTYYNFVIEYILHQITLKDVRRQEEIHFTLQQKFTSYFAKYLLAQSVDTSLNAFKKMTDWILAKDEKAIAHSFSDKRFELVENLLKDVLASVYREGLAPSSFWTLWEYVFEMFSPKVKRFNQLLLLNPGYTSQPSLPAMAGKKEFFKKVILELKDIDRTIWLLVGSGFDELMPEGVEWYADLIDENEMKDRNTIYLSEILAVKIYYDKTLRKQVKGHPRLKSSFISILDKLIDKNSAAAFLIREDFISLK